ncbi:MAG: YggT family protein [Candidatus Eisenbacteria bacterium]|uniref:YggT family protein n=1 Tax=Eiseniibacteriota bacterium TaxID=2212470 RepID=A0A9D6LAH1_UNCEI|nr:YggT family protein [Candidatus Eisenbacteria bacterium]MBI3539024.1 YggT family protein [Candidatus Eisenbacteria bacterium]
MFVIGNLVEAIAKILDVVLQLLMIVVLINALLSWVRPDPNNPIVMFLERVSDIVCAPIRRLFPTVFSGIDFAPFIAMLLIWFVQSWLVASLHGLALRIG